MKSAAHFFRDNRIFIKPYINVEVGKGGRQSVYTLTNKGEEIVTLLLHFKDYYSSL